MSALDHLPPDQRAVLALVLQRGRSYDEIAGLLSIDRAAVRDRALAALDALGPSTRVTEPRRALITDYLLGQLPDRVREQTRASLASSASERAWARVVSGELASIAGKPLPNIPSGQAAVEPARQAVTAPSPEHATDEEVAAAAERPAAVEAAADSAEQPAAPEAAERPDASAERPPAPEADTASTERHPARQARTAGAGADNRRAQEALGPPVPPREPPQRPSSRRGGAILLGVGVLIVVAVVIVLIATSGNSSPSPTTTKSNTTTPGTTTTGTGTGPTLTTPTKPHIIAQVSLKPPTASSKAIGIGYVVTAGKVNDLIVAAARMPPNTSHDAYAVWLSTPGGAAQFLGYVSPGVGKNGRLKTTGQLPGNVASYKELLVTRETTTNTKTPGPIVLQGPLSLGAG